MLMFKGASYFSLALGPSKLRTGPETRCPVPGAGTAAPAASRPPLRWRPPHSRCLPATRCAAHSPSRRSLRAYLPVQMQRGWNGIAGPARWASRRRHSPPRPHPRPCRCSTGMQQHSRQPGTIHSLACQSRFVNYYFQFAYREKLQDFTNLDWH